LAKRRVQPKSGKGNLKGFETTKRQREVGFKEKKGGSGQLWLKGRVISGRAAMRTTGDESNRKRGGENSCVREHREGQGNLAT